MASVEAANVFIDATARLGHTTKEAADAMGALGIAMNGHDSAEEQPDEAPPPVVIAPMKQIEHVDLDMTRHFVDD